MKLLFASLVLLSFSALANSEASLLCKRNSKETCMERVSKAFEKLGCQPVLETVECEDTATSPWIDPEEAHKLTGKDLCRVRSICDEPRYDLMGKISCSGESVSLAKVDKGITLTTSVGLFRKYVTTLCK